jgi:hypothetical protein
MMSLLYLVKLDDKSRIEAEQIIKNEISVVSDNPSIIKGNGCAACHVLFKVKELMHVSEQDAADLLSEVLLDNRPLNDEFISMVEEIHMKARMMGEVFAIKTREAKDRYIDSNFKNTLSEMMSYASAYGTEIVMGRLILSNIAQNLGVDYHAAMEELYYYMRKKDIKTHEELVQSIRSLLHASPILSRNQEGKN